MAKDHEHWMMQGRCRDFDPSLFDTTDRPGDRNQEARKICSGCQVLQPCLVYALVHGENYGIWGATGPDERARIRQSPRRLARILGDGGRSA